MSQRQLHYSKFVWCLLVSIETFIKPLQCVTLKPAPGPATVEAQAKYFQDFFSVQLSPYKLEFGHVCEDPKTWEQRYERKDYKNHRDMGKVRWGDKNGGYGEHYWDLNHAGHAGNDGYNDNDDGSYNHEQDHIHDNYDNSDQTPNYGVEDNDSDKSSYYEENGRAKRAHPRIKSERKTHRLIEEAVEEKPETKPLKLKHKTKEQLQTVPSHNLEEYSDEEDEDVEEEVTKRPIRKKAVKQKIPQTEESTEDIYEKKEKPIQEKEKPVQEKEAKIDHQETNNFVPRPQLPPTHYVPYESGAGVRQNYHPDVTVAAAAPRLFLEPSTGHVVDRVTGQAYVLQPINYNNYNQ